LETVEVVMKGPDCSGYTEWIAVDSQNKHWRACFPENEKRKRWDQGSPGVTHCQRTCKISTWLSWNDFGEVADDQSVTVEEMCRSRTSPDMVLR